MVANLFEPTELAYEEQQQFITQGGATFSTLSIQVEQQVPTSEVYRIQILTDLRSFEAEILQNPGTEILRTPL